MGNCPWLVVARHFPNSGGFVIREFVGHHTCLRFGKTTAITTAWIAEQN